MNRKFLKIVVICIITSFALSSCNKGTISILSTKSSGKSSNDSSSLISSSFRYSSSASSSFRYSSSANNSINSKGSSSKMLGSNVASSKSNSKINSTISGQTSLYENINPLSITRPVNWPTATPLSLNPKVMAVPATYDYSTLNWNGVQAIFFDGLDYNGKSTRVFAYIGFPAGASEQKKVPAVVLLHGGGGTAYPDWVSVWNDRGYAAIAIDLEGHMPQTPDSRSLYVTGWAGPTNQCFGDIYKAVDQQWMYHAVSDAIIANTLIRSDKRVDTSKVGVTGISWGGVVTSIVMATDPRFSFAIPIYGCGYQDVSLGCGRLWFSRIVANLWEPSKWLCNTNCPVLWLNGDNDVCFSVDSTNKSFNAVYNSRISIIHDFVHSHETAWATEESYTFADSICKGTNGLITVTKQPTNYDLNMTLAIPSDSPLFYANLRYATTPITYNADKSACLTEWKASDLTVVGNSINIIVPSGTKEFYVELINARGVTVTSNLVYMS
jgi:dienelactone hydrolase